MRELLLFILWAGTAVFALQLYLQNTSNRRDDNSTVPTAAERERARQQVLRWRAEAERTKGVAHGVAINSPHVAVRALPVR
jgi:hypothetical protein